MIWQLEAQPRRFPWRVWLGFLVATATLFGAISWEGAEGHLLGRQPTNYYVSATDAVLNGQLALKIQPRPELAQLSDPYDSALNQPYREHDLSYFHGKYYFYWGLSPVILFFAPLRLLFGVWTSEALSNAFFNTLAVGAWSWFILTLAPVFQGTWKRLSGLFVLLPLWACTLLPLLCSSDRVYSVPISCATAMFGLAACSLVVAARNNWACGPLLIAGVCFAFSIGARPNYALWSPICGLIILPRLWTGRLRLKLTRLTAFAGPPAALILVLLGMNWQRFGDPFDFGMRYQLAGASQLHLRFFTAEGVGSRAFQYLFHLPQLIRYFPFVRLYGDEPFGILCTFPMVLFGGLAVLRTRRQPEAWALYGITTGILGATVSAWFFVVAVQRYMVDFLPGLIALGSVGAAVGLQLRSRFARIVVVALLACSLAFGTCVQTAVWIYSRESRANIISPLATVANGAVYLLERSRGIIYGPVKLEVTFPRNRSGAFEPLIQLPSRNGVGELIFVTYVNEHSVRIGVFQTGTTHWLSEPIDIDFTQKHTIEVKAGSLLPPASHPFFWKWRKADADAARRLLEVRLDGAKIFSSALQFERPGVEPILGQNIGIEGVSGPRFSGVIHHGERVNLLPPVDTVTVKDPRSLYGPWRLLVEFPKDAPATHHDPILVSGVAGKGDFVYAFYPSPGKIAFGLDSWGRGGATGEIFSIDLNKPHLVVVEYGGLYPAETSPLWSPQLSSRKQRVLVLLDGLVVLDGGSPTHDAPPESVTPGENLIGGSSTAPRFLGKVLKAERAPW